MKRFVMLVLLVVGFLSSAQAVRAQTDTGWTIERFASDIIIHPNTTVTIQETIDVDFRNLSKHGIFRTIPVRYRTQHGNNLDIRFKLKSITNEQGNGYKYKLTHQGSDVELKIGDPDRTISGPNTYIITYEIQRVITTPGESAELYWNVTGTGWPIPIRSTTATIHAPASSIQNLICFTGLFGSSNQNCRKNHDGTTASFSTSFLDFNEGMTIAIALDPASLAFPSKWVQMWWFVSDNWLFATPLLTFLVMLRLYWTRGRDKEYKSVFSETGAVTIPMFEKLDRLSVYGPPKDLSPGEVGLLVDEHVHLQDITAIAIDLARRGFFVIKETRKKSFFTDKSEYDLVLASKNESGLREFEIFVLDMLFSKSRKPTVKLGKLHSTSYQDLDKAKISLYKHLTATGYFSGEPQKVRAFYLILGIVLIFSTFFVGPILGELFDPASIFALIVSGIIIIAFSFFMPARTPKGRKALKEVVGLREWIRLGAWRERIHEKHNFLEEVLPYTIAFGLTAKFLEAFKDSELKDLTWYQSGQPLTSMNLTRSFTSFNSSVNSAVAATRPRSSASSGGSGFSGGGSSGGGFGGGGGGSW